MIAIRNVESTYMGGAMIKNIKLQTSICLIFIVLSQNSYSLDELRNTEMTGLLYLNIPFADPVNSNFSPEFGFAIGRTRSYINNNYTSDVSPLLPGTDQRKMVDIQFDLKKLQFSRFAFGGINALVYDNTLHVDGDEPVIDPALVILGLGAGGLIYLILSGGSDNDDNKDKCNPPLQNLNFTSPTLALVDQCRPPPP